jgi:hypothetical protein
MANDVEQIQFQLGLRTDKFSKSLREVDKEMQRITKRDFRVPALDPKNVKKFKKEIHQATKETRILYKNITDNSKKHSKLLKTEVRDYQKAHRRIEDLVEKHTNILNQIRKTGDKDRIKHAESAARAEIRIAKRSLKEQQNILHNKIRKTGGLRVLESAKERTEKVSRMKDALDDFRWADAGKEVGEGFADVLSHLSSKDLAGAAKSFFSLGGRTLKNVGTGAMKFAEQRKGESGVMGSIARVIAKVAPSMEGIVKMVSTLGPLMEVFSSAIVGIVKLFIDVEAQAKELNKELMDGASLAETFASAGYDATGSYDRLSTQLQTIKDQTHDIGMNLAMGTNAKDHMAVINVLKREGLTLDGLTKALEANSKMTRDQAGGIQNWADVTKMSIGYSRLFGVQLDEISTFEAEMMTSMGASLKDVKMDFARMSDAAVESGIASNKFFAILRGVSTDLGLYATRLQDVTKMLKQLGKVMSPKMAEKFLGEFAKGLKDFSTDDRLKMVLLGGPGTIQDIKSSLQTQKDDIIKKLADEAGINSQDAEALLEGGMVGGKDLGSIAKEKGFGEQVGTMKEAYLNTKRGLKSTETQGVYGAAQGAKYLDAFEAYEVKKKAALGLSGKKTLEESIGLKGEKSAEAAGLGGDQFDAILGMERAIDQQRKDLINAFMNPNPTEDQKKLLKLAEKQGILSADMAKNAPDKAVWDSMTDTDAEAQKKADEQLKAAYESGKLSQSVLDKLGVIIDGIFNWLYKVLQQVLQVASDIYDALPFGDKAEKQQRKMEASIAKTQNEELAQLFAKYGSDPYKFKDEAINKVIGPLLDKKFSELHDLQAKRAAEVDPAKQKVLDDQIAQLTGSLNTNFAEMEKSMTGGDRHALLSDQSLQLSIGPDATKQLASELGELQNQNETINEAAQKLGINLSAADWEALQKKMPWYMNPENVAKGALGISSMSGAPSSAGAPGMAPTTGATAPTTAATPVVSKQPEPPVTEKQGDAMTTGLDGIQTDLGKIKIDKPFLNGPFDKTMYHSVLEAARQALWEFYLYKDVDKNAMLKYVKDNNIDMSSGSAVAMANLDYYASPHASGTGPMVGVDQYGFAKFAPGEAPTSIGVGEKIVPAGAAGPVPPVNVNVNGLAPADFVRLIESKVNEGIYEYKLRRLRNGG